MDELDAADALLQGDEAQRDDDTELDQAELKGMLADWLTDAENGDYLKRINKLKDTPKRLRLLVR